MSTFALGQKLIHPTHGTVTFERDFMWSRGRAFVNTRTGLKAVDVVDLREPAAVSRKDGKDLDTFLIGDFAKFFLANAGKINIYSNPSNVANVARQISENSSLSEIEAVDYVKPTSEHSHGAKYDVIFSNTIDIHLLRRLTVDYMVHEHHRHANEYRINNTALALYLMKFYDVLPSKLGMAASA